MCEGTGRHPHPDHTSYGLAALLCPHCKGAGQVRGYEKVVDTEPTAPPKVLRTKWDPSFELRKDWRQRAYNAIWKLRQLVHRLDGLLYTAERRMQPKGSLLKYDFPISKILENQSIKDIQEIVDQDAGLDLRTFNAKRVCRLLMDRVRRSWSIEHPHNAKRMVEILETHNDELRALGLRTPTKMRVEQISGQQPPAFLIELELDHYYEQHILAQNEGDQCGS